jgi:hypothetical protein
MESTTLHVERETADRFASLKRRIQARRDEDLNNSEVLDLLVDEYQAEQTDAAAN